MSLRMQDAREQYLGNENDHRVEMAKSVLPIENRIRSVCAFLHPLCFRGWPAIFQWKEHGQVAVTDTQTGKGPSS